jgi:hypothetical protein
MSGELLPPEPTAGGLNTLHNAAWLTKACDHRIRGRLLPEACPRGPAEDQAELGSAAVDGASIA